MLVALEQLKVARRAFFEAVAIPVTSMPPPASEAEVARLEVLLGQSLPPSYRAFLLEQDGFPELNGEVSILSVAEMISIRGEREDRLLESIAATSEIESVTRWLIFGLSLTSDSSYLFDPTRRDDSGEWPVMTYDDNEGIEKEYASFAAFLSSSAVQAAEALHEVQQSQDLSDIDF